jgi:hypothetical protein
MLGVYRNYCMGTFSYLGKVVTLDSSVQLQYYSEANIVVSLGKPKRECDVR